MDHSNSFTFIAVISTIASAIIVAAGLTWISDGQLMQEVAKSLIHGPEKNPFVPLQNTFNQRISQGSKGLYNLAQSLTSRPLQFRSQVDTIATTSRTIGPSVVIRTQRSNITIFPQLNENDTHHIFSTNLRPQNSTSKMRSNGGSSTTSFSLKIKPLTSAPTRTILPEKIAYVAPTFTTAAYNDKFYVFYRLEEHIPHKVNVTSNIDLLTSRVMDLPPQQIKHAFLGLASNLQVITDEDVNNGSIFTYKNTSGNNTNQPINRFDVLILGHQEYVTQKEYDNLRHFVASGGTLILLDGNVFYAQVSYDRHHHSITLVKGHGWAFNRKSAWKSVSERWARETSQWVGSNFLPCVCPVTFANDPFEYKHHEEQYITNHNDTILINYDATLITKHQIKYKPVIATYELHYKKGHVIALGLYSDDILSNVKFDKYFDTLLMHNFPKDIIRSLKSKL
jgi:hypothetical protein